MMLDLRGHATIYMWVNPRGLKTYFGAGLKNTKPSTPRFEQKLACAKKPKSFAP